MASRTERTTATVNCIQKHHALHFARTSFNNRSGKQRAYEMKTVLRYKSTTYLTWTTFR